jgi:serine/threonine protein phosphatase 1
VPVPGHFHIDVDTLALRTGRLVIGIFDDAKAGGPVDFIVVKGPPA